MNKTATHILIAVWLFAVTCVMNRADTENTFVITEFMALNSSTIEDEDGDTPDWIEIYNPKSDAVDIGGWYLTDSEDDLNKWEFPHTVLPPESFLLVFASGKNRAKAGKPLHTNFRLDGDGEYLALIKPDCNTIASQFPQFPEQEYNVSFGASGYMPEPSPGKPNTSAFLKKAEPANFSPAGGVFTNEFTLELFTSTPDADIRYTLDNSIPTESSHLYSNPIAITNSACIRTKVFGTGLSPSPAKSQTYTIIDANLRDFSSNLPMIILNTYGEQIERHMTSRVDATMVVINAQNDEERNYIKDTPTFNSRIGIEGRGQTSWTFSPKKGYNIELRDENDEDLDFPLLGLPAESDWILLNPYSDKTFLNNFLGHSLFEQMGHYAVRRRFVEVFLNGTRHSGFDYSPNVSSADYIGLYLLVEKIKVAPDRVDITPLTPADNSEPDITGGYIFKKDKPSPGDIAITTSRDLTLRFHDPDGYELSHAQTNWFASYIDTVESTLYDDDWRDPENGYQQYLDTPSFVNNFWLIEFSKQIDGFAFSEFMHKDRGGKIKKGPPWDWNLSFGNANYASGGYTNGWFWRHFIEATNYWTIRLLEDPDFRQKTIDRWGELKQSVFNPTNIFAIIDKYTNRIYEAQARDFNRFPRLGKYIWPNPDGALNGGAVNGPWHIDLVHPTTFSGIIGETKKWITGRFNWINNQIPDKPFLSRHTGAPAKPLTILTTNGEVYYTVDGSDPRAPGGEPSQTAVKYSTPFAPPTNSHIVARALITNTNIWSPPAEAVFGNPSPRLTVSELMYHPSPYPDDAFDNNEYEYIELLNPHTEAVNLSGLRFTDGISFIFPDTLLDPGDHILLVKNRDAFESRYGAEYQVFGEYNGALDNSGEYVSIKDCHGASIIEFTYDDSWSPLTDGLDFALTPRRINTPARDLDEAGNWRTGCRGGSPGLANPDTSARPRVLINEILAHAEDPLTDQIELFNPGANSVDIGHWFLSDDRKEPRKYVIPAPCIISPGDFYTISETKFNSSSEQSAGFGLDADGEGIFIFSADDSGELTGYCHGFEFGASDSSTSVGRHLTSIGDAHFVAQSCRTFGGSNSPPRVGPAVITEIMYHPRNGREYVELHNITSEQIALFDPEHPDNTWRLSNAIEFEFPPYTIIPAHGFLVITDFDPEQEPTTLELFRAEYDVPQNTHILGPFAGKLDNSGESIILTKPGEFDDDADEQPRVLVERVDFNDHAPWPFASDGIGYALQRIRPNRYGNDPANWAAIQPSPGANGRTQETPTITIQPQDQTVIAGTKAILNFKLQTEENFTYQWRFNNENLTNATNAALVFERISTSHAGTYQAVALSPTAAVESRTAEIKVLQAATIFEQPHDVAVAKGGNCTLSIVAAGNGELSYQWHHNGTAIPGATSPELEIRNAQSSDQGSYYVTITDAIGTIRSLTPAVAILTPPRILVSPVSRDVVEGNDVTSSIVTAGTPPFGYQWRMNGDILDTRITHNNTCFFTLKNVTKNQSGFIDVIVTNHANTNAVSESVLLRVLDDNDHDGMPDEWEQNHGLDPDAKDAAYDNDGDSMSNIEEFHAGTNPTNKASRLALRINRASPQSLTFSAAAGRTYNVQYTDAIQPMHWSTLISIPAYPTNRTVSVSDPSAAPVRFYRIVTPYRETQ